MILRGISSKIATKQIDATRACSRYFIIGVSLIVAGSNAHGDLAMETETARVLSPGHVEVGTAFEFQTSPVGEEYALPMAIEFGVLPRLEALIEPVAEIPSPSRMIRENESTTRNPSSVGQAISRRQLLVPRSSAA